MDTKGLNKMQETLSLPIPVLCKNSVYANAWRVISLHSKFPQINQSYKLYLSPHQSFNKTNQLTKESQNCTHQCYKPNLSKQQFLLEFKPKLQKINQLNKTRMNQPSRMFTSKCSFGLNPTHFKTIKNNLFPKTNKKTHSYIQILRQNQSNN